MKTAHISSTVPLWVRDFIAERQIEGSHTFSQALSIYLQKKINEDKEKSNK